MSVNLESGETYLGADGHARTIESFHRGIVRWRSVKMYNGQNVPYERSEGASMEQAFINWIKGDYHDGSRRKKKK